jgi:hypothetical protein
MDTAIKLPISTSADDGVECFAVSTGSDSSAPRQNDDLEA